MSKAHRGSGMTEYKNKGRGACPVCHRTGLKVIYEQEVEGKKVTVCKQCKAALARSKKKDAVPSA